MAGSPRKRSAVLACAALVLLSTEARAASLQLEEELKAAQERADYFEQELSRIEYYGPELAILHYRDSSSIRLESVESYTEAPIQSVNCHFGRSDLVVLKKPLGFTTYAEVAAQSSQHPKDPYSEHVRRVVRPIELQSLRGHIVPNHVNVITAPSLCRALNELEAEFVRRLDAMAEAMVQPMERILLVLNLAVLAEGLRAPASASGIATRTMGRVMGSGLSREAAEAALTEMRSGGGHAIRHLLEEGLLSNTGSLASKVEAFRRMSLPILTRPLGRPFAWRIGQTQATAFLGRNTGRWVAVMIAEDGPLAGKVIAAIVPDKNQLALMLGRAGLGGL